MICRPSSAPTAPGTSPKGTPRARYAGKMFAPFVVLAIAGTVVALITSRRKSANAAWAEAARRLRIELKPTNGFAALSGKLSMRGSIDGFTVWINTFQSNDKTHTRYRLRMPSLALGLKLSRQSPLAAISRFFGGKDIEVGQPLFDRQIMIKGDYSEQVRAFLTPARRVAISELVTAYRGATVSDTEIEVVQGFTSDTDELVSILLRLVSLARVLSKEEPALDRPAATRLAGDAGEALAELQQETPEGDPWIEFARKTQEAELSYVHGDIKEAADAFEQLSKQVPADLGLKAWRDKTRRRLEAEEEQLPTVPEDAGTAAEVSERLFHPDNYSFDTIDMFEADYEGKSVRWSGELKRLRRFDHDRDFGDEPGTKAVFAVYNLTNDMFAGREIDAVVHLPVATADLLDTGDVRTFTGTLARCDPSMRNFFVTNGALV